MKKLQFSNPADNSPEGKLAFALYAIREIETASHIENTGDIADAYTISNYTPTRTLDASTATVSDIANVVCTFIDDIKRRGVRKGQFDV